jgi:hypothetical protein
MKYVETRIACRTAKVFSWLNEGVGTGPRKQYKPQKEDVASSFSTKSDQRPVYDDKEKTL